MDEVPIFATTSCLARRHALGLAHRRTVGSSSDDVVEGEPGDAHDVAVRAPALASARSTPRLVQPLVDVGQRLEVRHVREGDGALRLASDHPPARVVLALDQRRPRRIGRWTTNASGSGSADLADADGVGQRPDQRRDARPGDRGDRSDRSSRGRRRRDVGPRADDDPWPVEQVGLIAAELVEQDPLLLGRAELGASRRRSTRTASALARSTCRRNRCPRPRPSLAPPIRPGTSATTISSPSSRRTTPRFGSSVVNG